MKLSHSQIDSYRQKGFLVLEGLIKPNEVEAIRADATKICRGEYPCSKLDPVPDYMSNQEAISKYLCIHNPHIISPFIRNTLAHQGISNILTQIIAPDVKCMQSMLFIKPPNFPGQAWHQDELYIPTRDGSLTGGWIALDDASVENGCLWVLPGSHQRGYLYAQKEHNRPEEFDFAQESYGFDDKEEIPVPCSAGSVIFFHGYLLHRSKKNQSDGTRRVLVNHYMNAFSLLPWKAREGEGFGQADYRDIVMVAGKDPYSWKGTESRGDVIVRNFDPTVLGKK